MDYKNLHEIELCAYKEFDIECGKLHKCCGYNESCHMYTTVGHLAEFNSMFEDPNNEDYESLEYLTLKEDKICPVTMEEFLKDGIR